MTLKEFGSMTLKEFLSALANLPPPTPCEHKAEKQEMNFPPRWRCANCGKQWRRLRVVPPEGYR